MIRVTIREGQDGRIAGFSCRGHAEYADAGRDIVCAAVSMLVINTVNSLEVLLPDIHFTVKTDKGKGDMELALEGAPTEETELLLRSMLLGLKAAEEQYGKGFIRIEEKGGK